MTGEIEAAGDVLTGSLLARSVETDSVDQRSPAHKVCANCKADLVGSYCHNCGQAGHVHNSLAAFGHDLLHGVFHFDNKMWRTLPLLIWKPGELTRRYIDGERAQFVSPLALFLFSIFAMFAVMSLSVDTKLNLEGMKVKEARVKIKDLVVEANAGIAELKVARNDRTNDATEIAAIDKQVVTLEAVVADAQAQTAALAKKSDEEDYFDTDNVVKVDGDIETSVPALDALLNTGIAKANKNPKLFLYKLQNTAYKYSWALIPLSLPFVWLMFAWRREFRLYDHIVFITYSLCFLSFYVIAGSLAHYSFSIGGFLAGLAVLIIPFHMYRQLKGTYRLGRGGAVVRTGALLVSALCTSVIFVALLVFLGLLG